MIANYFNIFNRLSVCQVVFVPNNHHLFLWSFFISVTWQNVLSSSTLESENGDYI